MRVDCGFKGHERNASIFIGFPLQMARNQVYRQRYRGFESHPLRRGFSAEKESHPHYQITGFSRSSGRGISYYRWGSKFILRSSKSHPLRQRAPLCTHSSFPKTFVTALTLRIGKKRSYYQITAVFHISGGRGSNLYEIEKPRRLVSVSSAFFRFF